MVIWGGCVVWVWGLGSGLGSLEAYSCANVMYREAGGMIVRAQRLTGEGTAIMACRPISAVVILI